MNKSHYSAAQVRKSLVYFLSGKMLSAIFGFLLVILLVRALSKEEYGAYIVLMALFELLQLATNLGAFPAVFRYVPELRVRNQANALYRLVRHLLIFRAITLVIVALGMSVMSSLVAMWLGMPLLNTILKMYAFVLVFEGVARCTDVMLDSLLMQGYAQISILLRNGLRIVALMAFLYTPILEQPFNLKVWIIAEAVASAIGVLISLFLLLKAIKPSAEEVLESADIDYKRISDYAIPAYLTQVIYIVQSPDVIKILAARLFGVVQAGAFGFAMVISGIFQRYLPVYLLVNMVRPLFLSAKEKGRTNSEITAYASMIFKINVFILTPILIVVMLQNKQISLFLSGGKFPEMGDYLIFTLLLLLVQSFRQTLALLMLVAEVSRPGLYGAVFGVVGVLLGVCFADVYGLWSLCLGMMVSEMIPCLVMQSALKRHGLAFCFDIKGILKFVASGLVSVGGFLLVKQLLPQNPLVLVMCTSVIVAVFYLLMCYCLKPFTASESNIINRMLPRPLFVW